MMTSHVYRTRRAHSVRPYDMARERADAMKLSLDNDHRAPILRPTGSVLMVRMPTNGAPERRRGTMNVHRATAMRRRGRPVGRRRALGVGATITGAALAAACGSGKPDEGGPGGAVELKEKQATVAAGEQPKSGGVGKYVTSGEPPDLDPRLTLSFGLHNWLGSIMNRVVRTVHGDEGKNASDFSLKPDLAASWEQPADLQSVTFKLRQGVTWHNKPPV